MDISIIIPAFNEESTIIAVLRELEEYMNGYLPKGKWEIVVVNDGSSDNTVAILEQFSKKNKWLSLVDLVAHQGRGKALRSGFDHAQGDVVATLDADLSYAPYHIERMIEALRRENADMVVASAFRKDGTVKNVPMKRLFLSKVGNEILSYMFGKKVTTLTCLVRVYKREFLDRLDLYSNEKEIHLEILYKAKMLNAKIVEVPADLYWRETKFSKPAEKGVQKRRSTLKVKETSNSHLFFAMLNKPGLIFWIPGMILFLIAFIILILTTHSVVLNVIAGESIYNSIRMTMLNAAPSWLTMTILFIVGVQFFTLGFITNQNKSNYEANYQTLNAIYCELKKRKK